MSVRVTNNGNKYKSSNRLTKTSIIDRETSTETKYEERETKSEQKKRHLTNNYTQTRFISSFNLYVIQIGQSIFSLIFFYNEKYLRVR